MSFNLTEHIINYIFSRTYSYFSEIKEQPVSNLPIPEVSEHDYNMPYDYAMLQENTPVCKGLYLECSERLFTKPTEEIPPCGDAKWSWFAAIYKDGRYLCGGTLINQQWLLTSAHCVMNFECVQKKI
jgi:hypothetical protein